MRLGLKNMNQVVEGRGGEGSLLPQTLTASRNGVDEASKTSPLPKVPRVTRARRASRISNNAADFLTGYGPLINIPLSESQTEKRKTICTNKKRKNKKSKKQKKQKLNERNALDIIKKHRCPD